MWNIITLIILLHSSLVSVANCDTKLTPLGDVLGHLGPTIIEKPNKVDDDVKIVSDAIKSTKLDPIVQLFGQRTLAQRIAIDKAFQKTTEKNINISTAINNILTGRHDGDDRVTFADLLEPLPLLLAGYISDSFSRGQGTSHWTYMSIISISSATKLKAIIEAYPSIHGKKLVDDVDQYVEKGTKENGIMNRMLDEKTMRPDSGSDPKLVDEQVKLIPGDCKSDKLMEFMTSSSYEQIKLVVDKWLKDNNNKNIVDAFRENCDRGITQEIYKRIIRYAANPYEYLAEELHLGVTGESHNLQIHHYIITARSEIDLKDILDAYAAKNGKLSNELDKWTKGYYVDLLKAVCNGNTGK